MDERFVKVGDHKIRYLESGNSDHTIVMLHGLGASAERWTNVIPIFDDEYHVIVPDLIGFGYSDKPIADYTPAFFANFIDDLLKTLHIQSPILMGSSLGGHISIEYSSMQNDIRKLVLVSSAGIMKQSTPSLDTYIMAAMYPDESMAKNAFETMDGSGRSADPQLVDSFIKRMRLPNAKFAFMSTLLGLKNSEPVTDKLTKISVPTLVVWGDNDTVIPFSYADQFVSAIPDCQLYVMDGCGHTPFVHDPYLFASKVLTFLNEDYVPEPIAP